MKPLNLDNSPCSPISSNCVIWQGPNIPCIKLCTGDTVSDVVFKLATELCDILEQLDINNYDLTCLNLAGCDPKDFNALIQILINKICELEGIPTPTPTPDGTGCPTDCIVSVVDCLGGGNDNLISYVETIANKICDILTRLDEIDGPGGRLDSIDVTLIDLQTQIDNIVFTIPDVTVPLTCANPVGGYAPGTDVAVNTLFEAFLDDWCQLLSVTGTTTALSAVLSPDCTLAGSAYFGSAITSDPGWINPASTVADALNNIWVSLCFLYNFKYKQTVVTGSGGVVVTSSFDAVTNTTTYDVTTSTPLTALMPAGAVIPWAGTSGTAPVGWVFCNGAIYDGADPVYATLFTVIGNSYGPAAPGFFAVPNLENRIPVGIGTNTGGYTLNTIGATGGSETVALTDNEIPPHTHDLSTATFSGTVTGTTNSAGTHNHRIWADVNDGVVSGAVDLTGNTGSWYDTGTNNPAGPPNDVYIENAGAHSHAVTGTATGTLSGLTGDGTPTLAGDPHGNMQPYVVMQYIIKL